MGEGRKMESSLSRVMPGGGTRPAAEDDADDPPKEAEAGERMCCEGSRAEYCGSKRGREGDGSERRMLLRFPVKLLLLFEDPPEEVEEVLEAVFKCCGVVAVEYTVPVDT